MKTLGKSVRRILRYYAGDSYDELKAGKNLMTDGDELLMIGTAILIAIIMGTSLYYVLNVVLC